MKAMPIALAAGITALLAAVVVWWTFMVPPRALDYVPLVVSLVGPRRAGPRIHPHLRGSQDPRPPGCQGEARGRSPPAR
jgi:hypothetical protein